MVTQLHVLKSIPKLINPSTSGCHIIQLDNQFIEQYPCINVCQLCNLFTQPVTKSRTKDNIKVQKWFQAHSCHKCYRSGNIRNNLIVICFRPNATFYFSSLHRYAKYIFRIKVFALSDFSVSVNTSQSGWKVATPVQILLLSSHPMVSHGKNVIICDSNILIIRHWYILIFQRWDVRIVNDFNWGSIFSGLFKVRYSYYICWPLWRFRRLWVGHQIHGPKSELLSRHAVLQKASNCYVYSYSWPT